MYLVDFKNLSSLISLFFYFIFLTPVHANEPVPLRGTEFSDMIGVNVHMAYSDTSYVHYNKIIQHLNWLGVDHVRDVVPPQHTYGGQRGAKIINILAKQGFQLTLAVNHRPFDEQFSILNKLEGENPGSIIAIEGFNEINNWPVTIDGKSGKEGAAIGQKRLYRRVKNSEVLSHIPVLNMTGHRALKDDPYPYGDQLDGFADADNFHIYAQNGMQPGNWIKKGRQLGLLSGKPAEKFITEFGYATMPQSGWLIIGVDELTQAKGILNGVFNAVASGFSRIFIYELVDQKADNPATKRGWHWGLFRSDGTPKPSAFAIKRLNQLLEEQADFTPESLDFSVQAPDSQIEIRRQLISLSDGRYLLALWHEPDFWDRKTGTPISAGAVSVTVDFGRSFDEIKTIDLIENEVSNLPGGNRASLPIKDYVTLLSLK